MKKAAKILTLVLVLAMLFSLASCGKKAEEPSDTTPNGESQTEQNTPSEATDGDSNGETEPTEKRKITVGFGIGGAPYEYLNEDGEPDGYDIKAMQAVAELLPQYEFEFVASSFEDVMTQVAAGTMQIGLNNSFWTPERAEKYTIPEKGLGACLIGMTVRAEDAECDTIEKCVDKGLEMVPVSSGDGLRVIIDQFNEEHPDKAVDFGTVEIYTLADFYMYVQEGRYDYLLMSAGIYDTLIAAEDGELHELSDQLVQHIIGAVNTYSLMAPGEDQLAKDVSEAIAKLEADGTLSKLQIEYTGTDAFAYLDN